MDRGVSQTLWIVIAAVLAVTVLVILFVILGKGIGVFIHGGFPKCDGPDGVGGTCKDLSVGCDDDTEYRKVGATCPEGQICCVAS